MIIKPVQLEKPHKIKITHSLNKSKTIVVGQTPKGSSYFKVIYKVTNQTKFGELFLKKANGEERALIFHNTEPLVKVLIEDSKDNLITRDRVVEGFMGQRSTRIIDKAERVGERASLKDKIYCANKMLIDGFIQGVEFSSKKSDLEFNKFSSIKSFFKKIKRFFCKLCKF
jgi:hypothetical protein